MADVAVAARPNEPDVAMIQHEAGVGDVGGVVLTSHRRAASRYAVPVTSTEANARGVATWEYRVVVEAADTAAARQEVERQIAAGVLDLGSGSSQVGDVEQVSPETPLGLQGGEPTAFHEAAHIVVGHVSGLKPLRASIVMGAGDPGTLGSTTYAVGRVVGRWLGHAGATGRSLRVDDPRQQRILAYLVTSVAGVRAERMLAKRRGAALPDHDRSEFRGNEEDFRMLELAHLLAGDDRAGQLAWRRLADQLADDILEAHWPLVTAIATELLRHGRLGRVRLARLLAASDDSRHDRQAAGLPTGVPA